MQTQGKLTEILAAETQLLKLREQSLHIYTEQPEKHMAETVGHNGLCLQDLFHGCLLTEAFQIDFAKTL